MALERKPSYTGYMRTRSWTDDQLAVAVTNCRNYKEVAEELGLYPGSKTIVRVRDRISALELDISHFYRDGRGGRGASNKDIFVKGIQCNTNHRRRYLQIVDYQCTECGIYEWLGKKLILQMDHVDGDRTNNTLENLRLLCPNCHSQTETWAIIKSTKSNARSTIDA